jgi:hypothetical protein
MWEMENGRRKDKVDGMAIQKHLSFVQGLSLGLEG